MKQAYLECGRIVNIHGFRGTVKAESFCDAPEILADLETVYLKKGSDYTPLSVTHTSVFKQFVLFDLVGIDSEEKANALRGSTLYARREDIPLEEGDFFIADLIGLPVLHADTGARLGALADVNTSGARDLYVVRNQKGDFMIPAVPEFITEIDPEKAIYLRPIEGLLETEDSDAL